MVRGGKLGSGLHKETFLGVSSIPGRSPNSEPELLCSLPALYKYLPLPQFTVSVHDTATPRIFHPLLQLLACATRQELARQVQYLKVENQILRSRLPQQIRTTPQERRQLVKAGRGLAKAISKLISIVKPETFLQWVNRDRGPKDKRKQSTRKPGRPRLRTTCES